MSTLDAAGAVAPVMPSGLPDTPGALTWATVTSTRVVGYAHQATDGETLQRLFAFPPPSGSPPFPTLYDCRTADDDTARPAPPIAADGEVVAVVAEPRGWCAPTAPPRRSSTARRRRWRSRGPGGM